MKPSRAGKIIIDNLRDKGIKITPQRSALIEILLRDKRHPSAAMLLAKAREIMPGISVSTVYYTLALLKKEGIIKELEFDDMESRYESIMTDHIDLICTKCRAIENFEGPLPVSVEYVEKETGFEAHRMRYEYYGTCRRCRESKSDFRKRR